ncbi:MAG: phosphatidylglycerophosphatase A family protein [Myxococcota bacterium]
MLASETLTGSRAPIRTHRPPRSQSGAPIKSAQESGSGPARHLVVAVATAAGAGFAPVAPGTFGSALALAIFVLFSPVGPALFALSWAALLALGVWAADRAERIFGADDGRIVIDEVVGQLLTLAPLLAFGRPSLGALVTGFVTFRVLDIWKPGPVGWAERRFEGGMGVMADDVVAGAFGAVVIAGLAAAGVFA